MKANEAPEKIILSADRETGILYDEWTTRDLTDNIKIEYIRKDSLIEKAKEFIWSHTEGSDYHVNYVLKEFENFMKGE